LNSKQICNQLGVIVLSVIAICCIGRPCFALDGGPDVPPSFSAEPTTQTPGAVVVNPYRTSYFQFSPYTSFQFVNTLPGPPPGGTGNFHTSTQTAVGPLFLYEKKLIIKRSTVTGAAGEGYPTSTVSLGAWYWIGAYTGGSVHQIATVYSHYELNPHLSLEADAGADPTLGFNEYYGFVMGSSVLGGRTSKWSADLGVGPYFPRREVGNTGYTATGTLAYRTSDRVSIDATYWYVNYKVSNQTIGLSTTNGLTRISLALAYAIN